jgi:hypothetical protein
MSFADLKKNRTSFLDKVTKEAEKLKQTNYAGDDDRLWQPTVDKAKNGYAVIRFLPPMEGEEVPWVRVWSHGFKGPTGLWYINDSLSTIGKNDPVSEYNTKLWNSGLEADKELARKYKRKLNYISNIYVVSDPGNRANEGKVFLYKYGKKIYDKANDLMHPAQFPGAPEVPKINPFDLWEGANFELKIREVEGYRNYDQSAFMKPEALADDKTLEKIYKQLYSLNEFVDPTKFKPYDVLKQRLETVLGISTGGPSARTPTKEFDADEDQTPPWTEQKGRAAPETPKASEPAGEEDDDVAYFKNMLSKS